MLKYFLVEFQPYGFTYILLRDEQLKVFFWLGASTSMYMLSCTEGEPLWSHYKINETNNQSLAGAEIIWEVDDDGERVLYDRSPYSIADVEQEKKYLLFSDNGYISAVKKAGQYFNLISMDLVDDNKQATTGISFINKKHFDL